MHKVSILTPVYNGQKSVKNCMDQVLNQTYGDIQHIIVNDGSADKTLDIINSYKHLYQENDLELVLINQENKGAAYAIKEALSKVSGEYVFLFDCDDYIDSTNIEKMVESLQCEPECNVVRCDGIKVDENLNYIGEFNDIDMYDLYEESYFENLLFGKTNNYAGMYMVKSQPLLKYYQQHEFYISQYGQNLQILLPVAYKSKCKILHEKLFKYYIYIGSHSHRPKCDNNGLGEGYKNNRIEIIKDIVENEQYKNNLIKKIEDFYNKDYLYDYFKQFEYDKFKNLYKKLHKKNFKYVLLNVLNLLRLNKVVSYIYYGCKKIFKDILK